MADNSNNDQRIDGDGQEVNALRFLGAPAITPAGGVSQPTQQPPPSQTPNPPLPPQAPQLTQPPMSTTGSFDYADPANYGSVPSVPISAPYGMPGQVPPGMMGGGPMMMMPPYNYMYPPYYMPGPYPSMPSASVNQSHQQLSAILNVYRVKDPKGYRDWYKQYSLHKRNPDRVPFPPIPGYPNITVGPGSSQTLPSSYGRSRKESTRSSVNGDSFRHPPNESFSNLDFSSHVPGAVGGGNSSMTHSYSRHHRQQPHSGRTSVNGEYRAPPEDDFEIDGADMSSLAGTGGAYGEPERPPTQSGRSSAVGDPYRLGDSYGGFPNQQPDSIGYESMNNRFQPIVEQIRDPSPRRMTPLKFSTFHCIATISPLGHLVRIKNAGATLEVLRLKQFVEHLPEYKELESFPGPLTRESVHKNTVIQFCRRKIQQARSNTAQIDRENFIFLWEFLIVMLRQNGLVDGSDAADLLLESAKQEEQRTAKVEEVRDDIEGDDGEGEEEVEENNETPHTEDPPPPPEVPPPRDENQLVKEFCEHLLHGHKKDALDFAMDNGLWGYALFFASKMDERSYGHVLARFANGIPLNSPLQTLYHVMCGKQPASVTSCADESFGDWRPHLAMLLSNTGYRPDVENKAILTLGDTLISRNHLYAAQFCYLMGHEEFRKDSRLGPLLGYSSSANNILEATQMTEVYEFARKLADSKFSLGLSFLKSKLEYSKSLISLGFVQEALSYCEEITKTLKAGNIGDEELSMCNSTLKIAERIAVADESGNAGTWIEGLKAIINDPAAYYGNFSRKPSSSTVSSTHEQGSDQLSYSSQAVQPPPTIPQQQENSTSYEQQQQYPVVHPSGIPEINNSNLVNSASIPQFDTTVPSSSTSEQQQENGYGMMEMPQENNWNNASQMNGGMHLSTAPQLYDVNQQQQQVSTNTGSATNLYNSNGNFQGLTTGGYPTPLDGSDKLQNSANNNYWNNNAYDFQQPQLPASNDSSVPPMNDQSYMTSAIKTDSGAPKPATNKKSGDQKKQGKEKPLDGESQSGWFSGIMNKLSLKPKNQMKLPDDKNPTIVWDDKMKRWVNTAADGEDDLAPAGPPPKDSDLMGANKSNPVVQNGPASLPPPTVNSQQIPSNNVNNMSYQPVPAALNNTSPGGAPFNGSVPFQNQQPQMNVPQHQQQHQQQLQNNSIPGMPPNSNPMNKYKLQKGRNIKNSYVDVFNPGGTRPATNHSDPPPVVPFNSVAGPQVPSMFVPSAETQSADGPVSFLTAAPVVDDVSSVDPNNSHPQAPPMFNPAQFQQGYPQGQ